jgi:hypothetical protein
MLYAGAKVAGWETQLSGQPPHDRLQGMRRCESRRVGVSADENNIWSRSLRLGPRDPGREALRP